EEVVVEGAVEGAADGAVDVEEVGLHRGTRCAGEDREGGAGRATPVCGVVPAVLWRRPALRLSAEGALDRADGAVEPLGEHAEVGLAGGVGGADVAVADGELHAAQLALGHPLQAQGLPGGAPIALSG